MPTIGGKNVFPQIVPEPHAPEPIPSGSILVIHIGSLYLRIGLASDTFPHTLPMCISRRHTNIANKDGHYEDPWLIRPETKHNEVSSQQINGLNAASQALQSRPTSFGGCRRVIRSDSLAEFNGTVRANMSEAMSTLNWTPVQHEPVYLVGQDALMVNQKEPYNIHWPIRRGGFNIHAGPGGTVSAVLQDIEDILSAAFQMCLSISRNDIKNYRAVLLIPDIYRRRHVRDLVDLLLNRLGFEAAFVVQVGRIL